MTTSKLRWFCLTPDRLVVGLLAVEGFLLLSEWFGWSPKGWTVLIAVATVGLTLLMMFLWFLAALLSWWRFQYSLRSLLLMVVVVAIPCSWLATEMQWARKQREAVEVIRKAGGTVTSDFDPFAVEPLYLVCFRELMGDDFFASICDVNLTGTKVTDAVLVHLQGLSQLPSLWLYNTQVTDAGLVHLQGLSHLQILWLNNTKVTDAGLVHLQGLSHLQILRLDNTKVTDAGLVHLQGLSHLRILALSNNTQVTDAGLVHFQGSSQLIRLLLEGTKVTDEGVRKLQQALPNCKIEH